MRVVEGEKIEFHIQDDFSGNLTIFDKITGNKITADIEDFKKVFDTMLSDQIKEWLEENMTDDVKGVVISG